LIHDWMGRRLLGADPLSIEHHWRFLYERASAFGARGAEMRAISAIDLALWDLLGQACNRPVWQLLGGKARDKVRVYNSSGGPSYGRRTGATTDQGWPGHGDIGKPGPLEDNWASNHAAGDLAEELLAEGYTAMKFWTFDRAYHEFGGAFLPWSAVRACVKPMEEVRNWMATVSFRCPPRCGLPRRCANSGPSGSKTSCGSTIPTPSRISGTRRASPLRSAKCSAAVKITGASWKSGPPTTS
jgi:L-alanine-DL-glutamate epimerase-like enolase superfamily enzyme